MSVQGFVGRNYVSCVAIVSGINSECNTFSFGWIVV